MTGSEMFFNRELSWLEFNSRVLEEARDADNPLFERLKFLSICSSNLDEFFMVRVSSVAHQAEISPGSTDPSGKTPKEQLKAIADKTHNFVSEQYKAFGRAVKGLKAENIEFVRMNELTGEEAAYVDRYFNTTLFPILTPMAIDKSRPFPFLNNITLNILFRLKKDELTADSDERLAVIQVPTVVPRFFEVKLGERFILLEEIIKFYALKLFVGNTVESSCCFRITRDSDLDIDEEDAPDLLDEVERSVKKRKWGGPIRLEIERNTTKNTKSTKMLDYLQDKLRLSDSQVYEITGPLDLTFLMSFAFQSSAARPELANSPLYPTLPKDFDEWDVPENIFNAIKKDDLLVHHPYQSFDCVTNFVAAAAKDESVLAIKQTLYRVSGRSPVVQSLIQAAEAGKQVTVLVELKARFDEENNILWAKKLEQAGCHVVYGLVGMKVHCKMCLIVRREDDGIHRYVHLGTGNYNDSTARIYTDLGYFTCKESIAADVSSLFNVLTGYSSYSRFNKLVTAPNDLRARFISLIENEAANAQNGLHAEITAKMNSLSDPETIEALYRASKSGVKITLIVRGICCLRPGIEGLSDNIRVFSVVGRYLEHSRIYKFAAGGDEQIYIASADWMQRNFDRRVEIAFPIEDEALKQRISHILDTTLEDNVKMRELQSDGSYKRAKKRGKAAVSSQLALHARP